MQIEIVNLNDLLKKNHPYRILFSMIDFFWSCKKYCPHKKQSVG